MLATADDDFNFDDWVNDNDSPGPATPTQTLSASVALDSREALRPADNSGSTQSSILGGSRAAVVVPEGRQTPSRVMTQ